MKSIAKHLPSRPEQKFPCMKIGKGHRNIVLFSNKHSGTVVHGERLGNYSTGWSDCTSENWEDFGEVDRSGFQH